MKLAAGEIFDLPVSVALTAERAASHTQPVYFQVTDVDQPEHHVSVKSTFVAPLNR
ncbi:Ubp3 associated protein Bre5 [compost metagenome]